MRPLAPFPILILPLLQALQTVPHIASLPLAAANWDTARRLRRAPSAADGLASPFVHYALPPAV